MLTKVVHSELESNKLETLDRTKLGPTHLDTLCIPLITLPKLTDPTPKNIALNKYSDDIAEQIKTAEEGLLPSKFKEKYEKHFLKLLGYLNDNLIDIQNMDDNIGLAFLKHLSESYAISSLWSIWSACKKILGVRYGINGDGFYKCKSFLKNLENQRKDEDKDKKRDKKSAPIFSRKEIEKFLKFAPDKTFLREKAAIILGIYGRLRAEDYPELYWNMVEELYERVNGLPSNTIGALYFDGYKGKNKRWSAFIVKKKEYIDTLLKYKERTGSKHSGTGRVFWQERKGRVHGQHLGRSWFYSYTKQIAKYLGKSNWNKYSGHSVCRSGATLYAEHPKATALGLKRYGKWKSLSVAERYIAESPTYLKKQAAMIDGDDSSTFGSSFGSSSCSSGTSGSSHLGTSGSSHLGTSGSSHLGRFGSSHLGRIGSSHSNTFGSSGSLGSTHLDTFGSTNLPDLKIIDLPPDLSGSLNNNGHGSLGLFGPDGSTKHGRKRIKLIPNQYVYNNCIIYQ